MADELISNISFKKGPNGDIAYINGKLKLKNQKNAMEIDNIPEKSKIIFIYFEKIFSNWYFFSVPRIDDQLFTLEPLAEHVSLSISYMLIIYKLINIKYN